MHAPDHRVRGRDAELVHTDFDINVGVGRRAHAALHRDALLGESVRVMLDPDGHALTKARAARAEKLAAARSASGD